MSTRTQHRTNFAPPAALTPPHGVRCIETPVGGVRVVNGRSRDEVSLGRLMAAVAQLEQQLSGPASWVDVSTLESLRRRLARLGAETIDARIERDPNHVARLEDQVADFQAELKMLRSAAVADRSSLDAVRNRVRQLEDALVAAHKLNVDERDRSATLERQVDELEQDLTTMRAEDARTRRRIDALRTQVDGLKNALGSMRARERAAKEEVIQVRTAAEMTLAENDLLRAELADTQALLRDTHAELKAVSAENESLRLDLEEAHAENDIMERWMNRALARVSELQDAAADEPAESNVVAFPGA